MENWLPSLKTATPSEGYVLAIKLSRMTVKLTQTDAAVRERLRPAYATDADALIAISQVVATHFSTIAAANDYWREVMSDVTVGPEGFMVDAALVARGFGLDPGCVPAMLREGRITSRCEAGIDADAGRYRLTFFHGARALRLIVDGQGALLQQARFPVSARRDLPQG
jgi:hypothetical protein